MSSAPFVGRADEIAALERALGEGRRLLTIWGPAGIGKTRLAQRLLERRAADEGWFCDLAAASDASEICAALARDLRVTRDELASVATALVAPGEHVEADELALVLAARGETLVVLDNFEQVSAYAPETLGRFVAAAPQVCFVVTSRERLRLSAEIAFELAPLSLAARDDGDASEAVTLLIERVRAAQPSYQPSADDVASLAEIARVLEGIPLALELAAARVEMLGAAGVLRRLRDEAASTPQLALLSRGRRDAPDRQATLQRAIEWSWSLLGEIERAALAQLSVFRGGFSAAAAEAVLASVATPPSGSTLDVLDVLSSLRDKSLLRARPKESGSSELRLYESVRELAASKLARQGGAAAAETAHADYYLRRAREVLAEVVEIEAFELANLLVVVQRLLAQPLLDAGAADDLLTCLLAVDRARGSSAGHLELLERGIDACRGVEGAAPALRARALRARGKARQLRGRLAGAIDDLEAALSLSREAEQAALEGDVLADIGVVFHQQRAIDKAAARYDEALARYRELGDRRAEARVQANLAALHHDQRRFEEAARDYQRALTIFAEVGDQRLAGVHRTNLGILEQERGELAEAEACFERALAILHSAGEARYEAIARGSLGVLRHEQGRLDDARACHEAALHVLGEVADVKSEALCRCRLAMVCAEADQPQGAADHLQAAEALFSGLGSSVEQAVGALARGFIELGEARRAAAAGDEA
ncbi:MAG: tetratricopeptide repeat protein, partial [Myxococcales bacterium]|nr:tetratricopeptide repeat protein [Myxococcales bacterium]